MNSYNRIDRLADFYTDKITSGDYTHTYHNIHHFTWESILPIIRDMDKFTQGAIIKVPNFPGYPVDLIKRILPEQKVEVVEVNQNPDDFNLDKRSIDMSLYLPYINAKPSDELSIPEKLCRKLLSYIDGKKIEQPSIMINVRLANRRWLPLSNIQELVNRLVGYHCYIFINPEAEKISKRFFMTSKDDARVDRKWLDTNVYETYTLPEIKGATIIKDASYEERLAHCHIFHQ